MLWIAHRRNVKSMHSHTYTHHQILGARSHPAHGIVCLSTADLEELEEVEKFWAFQFKVIHLIKSFLKLIIVHSLIESVLTVFILKFPFTMILCRKYSVYAYQRGSNSDELDTSFSWQPDNILDISACMCPFESKHPMSFFQFVHLNIVLHSLLASGLVAVCDILCC